MKNSLLKALKLGLPYSIIMFLFTEVAIKWDRAAGTIDISNYLYSIPTWLVGGVLFGYFVIYMERYNPSQESDS